MTKEEAIELLFDIQTDAVYNVLSDEKEALELAINVLKQQPCEDCISRQAAIDALWKALYEYEDKTEKQFNDSEELDIADWIQHRAFVQNMSDIDRQTILNMPSVTPTRPTARWERLVEDYNKCSKCGEMGKLYRIYKYCPNCGAKMQEVEE